MQLLDIIREKMGFPPFIKIDPNTQEMADNEPAGNKQRLGQSAICAVVAGLYKYTRSEDGFEYLINKDRNLPWNVFLFGEEEDGLVGRISNYSNADAGDVRNVLQEAGNTTWHLAEQNLEGQFSFQSVGKLVGTMRNDVLHYLPPVLQLGKILNDNSLDDRTNKMEGPVSGLMHKIEKLFSEPQRVIDAK